MLVCKPRCYGAQLRARAFEAHVRFQAGRHAHRVRLSILQELLIAYSAKRCEDIIADI